MYNEAKQFYNFEMRIRQIDQEQTMASLLKTRHLGKSGPIVSPMGVGTWAMGGPFFSGEGDSLPTGTALGWGKTQDTESIAALRYAVENGITLFDTADCYGAGHSEEVLGKALLTSRDQVLIATKFGNTFNPQQLSLTGTNVTAKYIQKACEDSLRRLQTSWIDLYQLHIQGLSEQEIEVLVEALESLCDQGKIRYYGWSTDQAELTSQFLNKPRAVALQFDMNVINDAPQMLESATYNQCAAIIRSPLAMGFLSGKYHPDTKLPSNDIRSNPPEWVKYFTKGGAAKTSLYQSLQAIREILTSNNRTLVQGALAWIWARDSNCIPIPGIRTIEQAKENIAAIEHGPLSGSQVEEITDILAQFHNNHDTDS